MIKTRVVADREPGSIYIGRAGRGQLGEFGNPFVVGRVCSRCRQFHATAASTLPCFRAYFAERMDNDEQFRVRVLSLVGRALWCPGRCKAKDAQCHGDVYVEWLERRE